MSTRSATGKLRFNLDATIKNILSDGTPVSHTISQIIANLSLTNGVSVDEISRAWAAERTLATGATETLDLYSFAGIDIGAGSACDGLGQALVMENCVVFVVLQTAGPGRLEINSTVPATPILWMPALTVATGGALQVDGFLIMGQRANGGFGLESTAKNVHFKANGGAVEYVIVMLGRHDDDESSSSSSSTSSPSSNSSSSPSTDSSHSSKSSSSSSSTESSVNSSSSSASSINSSSSTNSSSSSVNSSSSSSSTSSLSTSSSVRSSQSSSSYLGATFSEI